jgi:DNA-binding CsgD family transcriptional regulator
VCDPIGGHLRRGGNPTRRTTALISPTRPIETAEHLLERTPELDALGDALRAVRATRRGRLVVVGGEAGIGKTTLVQAFCLNIAAARVLTGACEALQTARPLGPLVDIASETGGELEWLVERGSGPIEVLAALLGELRKRPPNVVVIEDLNRADGATLDLVRLLARRIETVPALVVITYRDDEVGRTDPLRRVLGELPRTSVDRLQLERLSEGAVDDLARPYEVDSAELHRVTGGNPFYVTEALAAGGTALPESVRDAVLARAARLPAGARALLDAVAIAPPRAELWLLEEIAAVELAFVEEGLTSGMLRVHRDGIAFRHEIERVAIEETLLPDRRHELHGRALRVLAGPPRRADVARVAHHAEAAGDIRAVLEFAPAAAERAHGESAAQFARALRFADGLPGKERAHLLERRAYECYLIHAIDEAIAARRLALVEHRSRRDRLREGDTRRWLSRLAWFFGDGTGAEAEARAAIRLLEPLPSSPELAMAYSNMAQLRMLAGDVAGTREWGARAIELAERLGYTDVLVHALNNVGSAELSGGSIDGAAKLERSLQLAADAGLEEHVARAHTNLAVGAIETREYALADRHLAAGIEYSAERDLDSWVVYMKGWRARADLEHGRWEEAAAAASAVIERPRVPNASMIGPLVVLGRIRARRGDGDPWELLDRALVLAEATGELQRLGPVASARAEAHWLTCRPDLVGAETERALALATRNADAWAAGELVAWRHRAGIREELPTAVAGPYRLELAGEPEAAARLWAELGCPYDAALVRLESDCEEELRLGHDELQRLGARVTAAHAARLLRERGARDLRQGPRAPTRANPAGLTGRQLEVLGLLAEGLRNSQIADRLVLSPKTVDHHVSAVLRKLDVGTRTEAAAEAGRLGIVER